MGKSGQSEVSKGGRGEGKDSPGQVAAARGVQEGHGPFGRFLSLDEVLGHGSREDGVDELLAARALFDEGDADHLGAPQVAEHHQLLEEAGWDAG